MTRYKDLRATHGIKLTAGTGGYPLSVSNIDSNLAYAADLAASDALAVIEGPNEPDQCNPDMADSRVQLIREAQAEVYTRAKARTVLRPYPVLAPALCASNAAAKIGNLSASADAANHHPYPNAYPFPAPWYDEVQPRLVNPDGPIFATETGYHNTVNAPSTEGHRPTTERVSGIYAGQLPFGGFNKGLARSYFYELVDGAPDPERDDRESNFGLYRNDWSPKPSATAIKNVINILRDPGPAFTPRSLKYRVSGDLTNVQQTLLQKRDGTFFLALWHTAPIWDPFTKKDLYPSSRSVKLELETPIAKVERFRPNQQATPVSTTASPTVLDLQVQADVTIVKLTR